MSTYQRYQTNKQTHAHTQTHTYTYIENDEWTVDGHRVACNMLLTILSPILLVCVFVVFLCQFVSADIPLFNGIVRDLFPTVDPKGNERSQLMEAITNTLIANKLQPAPAFMNKCIELYDTFLVRHGLMLVGATMSGKSTAAKTLQRAITSLSGIGNFNEVNAYYINPKSVQLNELYGTAQRHDTH